MKSVSAPSARPQPKPSLTTSLSNSQHLSHLFRFIQHDQSVPVKPRLMLSSDTNALVRWQPNLPFGTVFEVVLVVCEPHHIPETRYLCRHWQEECVLTPITSGRCLGLIWRTCLRLQGISADTHTRLWSWETPPMRREYKCRVTVSGSVRRKN